LIERGEAEAEAETETIEVPFLLLHRRC